MRSQGISRRAFLQKGALGAAALALPAAVWPAASDAGSRRRPNVLFILTDQQRADMLSCAGNPYLKTPAMDSLAENGARFELAYCAHPLCIPSRTSMLTGVMPSRAEWEIKEGKRRNTPADLLPGSLGVVFRNAGYETAYGGKTHVPMTIEQAGFDYVSKDTRSELAQTCADFLRQKHERPFLLAASFINPHDICSMAITACKRAQNGESGAVDPKSLPGGLQLPEGATWPAFVEEQCPPLPANFEIPKGEPESVREVDPRPFRFFVREHWTESDWRLHRWAYCRLTEKVDSEIGVVLQALRAAGLEEDTLVVFSSDHGDLDASHRLEHKSVLYEEAMRVPFLVSWKGVTRPGLVDNEHFVSTGLDLIPTLCDFAGIPAPEGRAGRSVRPLAEGRRPDSWRENLVAESRHSRALRTVRYKYTVYDAGEAREALVDLRDDPGEMRNLARDPNSSSVLESHRASLRRAMEESDDPLADQFAIRLEKTK